MIADPRHAVLVNAGVTHPPDGWLDALTENGRMVMPLTAAMGPSNIGKGLLLTSTADPQALAVRLLTFVAIFSAEGVRSDVLNGELAGALATRPFGPIKRLRRDAHERTDACWMHGPGVCFSSE
jgi:protein-L-isoaspartate(D-aspartate) O-methyltransferase